MQPQAAPFESDPGFYAVRARHPNTILGRFSAWNPSLWDHMLVRYALHKAAARASCITLPLYHRASSPAPVRNIRRVLGTLRKNSARKNVRYCTTSQEQTRISFVPRIARLEKRGYH